MIVSSCRMIDVVMYGMIFRVKMVICLKLLLVKVFMKLRIVFFICFMNLVRVVGLMFGVGMM